MTDVISLADREAARARRLKAIEAVAVRGMNTREAAAFAGLSPGSLKKVLQDDRVKKYIADMQKAHAEALNIRREDVIKGILKEIDHASMINEPNTAIRGWEAIAKLQGLNEPERHIHDLPEDTKRMMEAMSSMTDSELAKLANLEDVIELEPGKDFRETQHG